MACGSLTSVIQKALDAQANLDGLAWFTGWIPCTGLDRFTAILRNRGVNGFFRSQIVAQFAAVRTDEPDAPIAYGSTQDGAGERCIESGDISSTASTKFYVRFGVKYTVSQGTAPARADVELQVAYDMCGQVVGAFDEQLVATSDTKVFVALTPWLPSLHAAKMKAAVVVNSLSGNFKWRLTYRTATASVQAAHAWEANWDPTNNVERGATEINTGQLTPSTSGKMWVQFGIMIYLSSGYTGPGQASVQASVAVRK